MSKQRYFIVDPNKLSPTGCEYSERTLASTGMLLDQHYTEGNILGLYHFEDAAKVMRTGKHIIYAPVEDCTEVFPDTQPLPEGTYTVSVKDGFWRIVS